MKLMSGIVLMFSSMLIYSSSFADNASTTLKSESVFTWCQSRPPGQTLSTVWMPSFVPQYWVLCVYVLPTGDEGYRCYIPGAWTPAYPQNWAAEAHQPAIMGCAPPISNPGLCGYIGKAGRTPSNLPPVPGPRCY